MEYIKLRRNVLRNMALRRISKFIFAGFFVASVSAMQQAPSPQVMTPADGVKKVVQFLDEADCCDRPIELCVQLLESEQEQQRIQRCISCNNRCNSQQQALCCCGVACFGSCIECPGGMACCCGITGCGLFVLYKALKKERRNNKRGD